MKRCDICKQELSIELFGKNKRNKDGLHTTCKPCKKIIDKNYRLNNKDKIKVAKHEHYLKNKDKIKQRINDYISKNRDKHNEWKIKAKNKLKLEVFVYYGQGQLKCNFCDEFELNMLTIDHVNGNGNKHREKEGIKTGYSTYQWLKKNNYPDGFQVLCWNCQFKKKIKEVQSLSPSKRQLQLAKNVQLVKLQCMEKYGGVCSCGEFDLDVLTLDHINDDGAKHRKETNMRGSGFYLYLRRNNFPNNPPLQVLCIKCQYRKMYDENGKRKKYQTIDN